MWSSPGRVCHCRWSSAQASQAGCQVSECCYDANTGVPCILAPAPTASSLPACLGERLCLACACGEPSVVLHVRASGGTCRLIETGFAAALWKHVPIGMRALASLQRTLPGRAATDPVRGLPCLVPKLCCASWWGVLQLAPCGTGVPASACVAGVPAHEQLRHQGDPEAGRAVRPAGGSAGLWSQALHHGARCLSDAGQAGIQLML